MRVDCPRRDVGNGQRASGMDLLESLAVAAVVIVISESYRCVEIQF